MPFAYLRSFDHLLRGGASRGAGSAGRKTACSCSAALGSPYPKQLLLEHPGVALDVVEIDPAMVQIAWERFFLDRLEMQLAAEGRADDLRIFVEDGEAFLRRSDGVPYDAIINDVFVGRRRCRSSPATRALLAPRAHLTPGGLLMANCVRNTPATPCTASFSQVERLRGHFANVRHRRLDDEFGGADNYLLIATDGSYPFHRRHPLRGLGAAAR